MTGIEHGLIGGAVVLKTQPNLYWWAFLAGNVPDIIPFAWAGYKIGVIKGIKEIIGDHAGMPESVYRIYYFSHSFVTAFVLYLVLYLVQKDLAILAIPYALHVLCDIPFHNSRFSTRFLYPLSNFHIHGYSQRLHRWVHIPLILGILVLYVFLLR